MFLYRQLPTFYYKKTTTMFPPSCFVLDATPEFRAVCRNVEWHRGWDRGREWWLCGRPNRQPSEEVAHLKDQER